MQFLPWLSNRRQTIAICAFNGEVLAGCKASDQRLFTKQSIQWRSNERARGGCRSNLNRDTGDNSRRHWCLGSSGPTCTRPAGSIQTRRRGIELHAALFCESGSNHDIPEPTAKDRSWLSYDVGVVANNLLSSSSNDHLNSRFGRRVRLNSLLGRVRTGSFGPRMFKSGMSASA